MSLLVALSQWDAETWRVRFKTALPKHDIVVLGEPFDRRAVHYVASWKHPAGALDGLPNLATIFSLGAGVDHLFADSRLPNVPIARIVDPDLTTRMSEYIILHCLLALRQHRRYAAQQLIRSWDDDRNQPAAKDVRVGLLGLGVLGLDAASRTGHNGASFRTFAAAEQLPEFLAHTDILVCLLPLTDGTRGLLNLDLFRQLPRDGRLGGPVLINAARGGIQVENDIMTALDEGSLQSATLDVFETEPLPQDSPLWNHPRVTVTPHNAAMSEPTAIVAAIANQIARIEAGYPLENSVHAARGY
jgi:glyoxylate/hydroxypyruvate reductase